MNSGGNFYKCNVLSVCCVFMFSSYCIWFFSAIFIYFLYFNYGAGRKGTWKKIQKISMNYCGFAMVSRKATKIL